MNGRAYPLSHGDRAAHHIGADGSGINSLYGVDGKLASSENVRINTYLGYEFGGSVGGSRRELSYSGRAELNERFAPEPDVRLNWIELPNGEVRAAVSRLRATYTVSPRSVLSALVQYNSESERCSVNLRFRREYSPGSDLFVVFSSNRDGDDGLSGLTDRPLVVRFTRLFRF